MLSLVYPGKNINPKSYNEFYNPLGITYNEFDSTEAKIGKLNLDHSVFKNVFEKVSKNMNLPIVYQKYKVKIFSNSNSTNIISLTDLSPFMIYSK